MKKKKKDDIFQYRNMSSKEKKDVKIAGAIVLAITTIAIAIRKKGVIIKTKLMKKLVLHILNFRSDNKMKVITTITNDDDDIWTDDTVLGD